MWIVDINGEEPITEQGVLDELNRHQTPGRANKGHILNKFALYLIKSDLWFHALNFVYQRNLPHQIILVKL